MLKKIVPVDEDTVNDIKICEQFAEGIEKQKHKYGIGEYTEYRYNDKEEDWKPALILEQHHNAAGQCIYRVFATKFGHRITHESRLFDSTL